MGFEYKKATTLAHGLYKMGHTDVRRYWGGALGDVGGGRSLGAPVGSAQFSTN